MTKFWAGVGVLFVLAIGVLATEAGNVDFLDSQRDQISFSDLETECRFQTDVDTQITLNNDRSLGFEGHYPEKAIDAKIGYKYSVSSDRVRLNVKSSSSDTHSDFLNDCLASVKYVAETEPLDSGMYTVVLQHNGETVQKQVIEIK